MGLGEGLPPYDIPIEAFGDCDGDCDCDSGIASRCLGDFSTDAFAVRNTGSGDGAERFAGSASIVRGDVRSVWHVKFGSVSKARSRPIRTGAKFFGGPASSHITPVELFKGDAARARKEEQPPPKALGYSAAAFAKNDFACKNRAESNENVIKRSSSASNVSLASNPRGSSRTPSATTPGSGVEMTRRQDAYDKSMKTGSSGKSSKA